jgi:hypothetical protein
MMYTEIYQNQCSAEGGIENWETSCFAVNNEATEPIVEVICLMKFLYQVLYVSILPVHTNLLLCNLYYIAATQGSLIS